MLTVDRRTTLRTTLSHSSATVPKVTAKVSISAITVSMSSLASGRTVHHGKRQSKMAGSQERTCSTLTRLSPRAPLS